MLRNRSFFRRYLLLQCLTVLIFFGYKEVDELIEKDYYNLQAN